MQALAGKDGQHVSNHTAPVARQPALPIKLDSIRPSDRIRARLYRDTRIPPGALLTLIVIADHVRLDDQANAARLKLTTIGKWTHQCDRTVREAIGWAKGNGVLAIDRRRTWCRYVFLTEWIARWEPEASTADKAESVRSRVADSADHDRQNLPITGEPYVQNQLHVPDGGIATAGPAEVPREVVPVEGRPVEVDRRIITSVDRAVMARTRVSDAAAQAQARKDAWAQQRADRELSRDDRALRRRAQQAKRAEERRHA